MRNEHSPVAARAVRTHRLVTPRESVDSEGETRMADMANAIPFCGDSA